MSSEIPYRVRRSKRAKRVLVNVGADADVEVVLPLRSPQRAAAAAIEELRPWIMRRLAETRATLARRPGFDGTVPYLGVPHRLAAEPGRRRVHRSDGTLLVPAGDARPALERFFRRAARVEIGARLDRATALAGTSYRGLTIRSQRTRWASCSAAGRMSFNWRLLLAPEAVVDYVVWHEVCHLEVPRFWALVERRWPSWRGEREWLRRNGPALMLPVSLGAESPS